MTPSVRVLSPRRVEILALVWDQERSVKEIAARLTVSVSAVSQHLKRLREDGLVTARRQGRNRFYRARRQAMGPLGPTLEALWAAEGRRPPRRARARSHRRSTASRPTSPLQERDGAIWRERAQPVADVRAAVTRHDRSDDLTSWYRHGLHARVVALTIARAALEAGESGAPDSIRRIARSLGRAALAERFGALAETARAVAGSGPEELAEGVDRLIGALRAATLGTDVQTATILVVEDSRLEAVLYRSILGGPHREVLIAASGDEARAALEAHDVDLILLDLTLPGGDGRDLLIGLGHRPRTAHIPVILLTGRTDALTRTEAMSLGADAYYTKPVERPVLSAAVAMTLERSAEARQLGRRDPLTGLKNRAVFLEDLRQIAAAAVRADIGLALAIVDIDGLDVVNDVHGSEIGDDVVRVFGDKLRASFRDSDAVARWGGGKFAIAFTNTDAAGAATALGKLGSEEHTPRVALEDGTELTITCRAGVASVRPRERLDDVLARATRRLQIARRGSRGRIVTADSGDLPGARTVLLVEDDRILADLIRHRLGRDGFEVVHFENGAEAVDALARVDASAVVLDTMLPGADGFEVLRRLRASPAHAGVPVLVLTFGSEHDAARAFKLGASDSLAKPFPVEELVARVTRLVEPIEERPE